MNFKPGTVIPMVIIQVISDSIFTLEKFANLIFTYTDLPYLLNLNVITIGRTLSLNLINSHKNSQNTTVLVCSCEFETTYVIWTEETSTEKIPT